MRSRDYNLRAKGELLNMRSIKHLSVCLVIGFLVVGQHANAATKLVSSTSQAAQAQNQSTAQAQKPAEPSPFGLDLIATASSDTKSTSEVEHQDELSFRADPSYRFDEHWSTKAIIVFSQQTAGFEKSNGISDIPVELTYRNILNSKEYLLSASGIATAPTSTASQQDSLNTALGARGRIVARLQEWTLRYDLTLTRMFHQFETSIAGKVNKQFRVSHLGLVTYDILPELHFTLSGTIGSNWSYLGNTTSTFGIDQEIGYDINEMVSVAIGHTNNGDTLSQNGIDSNISIFNENSSMFYLQMALSI